MAHINGACCTQADTANNHFPGLMVQILIMDSQAGDLEIDFSFYFIFFLLLPEHLPKDFHESFQQGPILSPVSFCCSLVHISMVAFATI